MQEVMKEIFENEKILTKKEMTDYCQALGEFIKSAPDFPKSLETLLQEKGFKTNRYIYLTTKIDTYLIIDEDPKLTSEFEEYEIPTAEELLLIEKFSPYLNEAISTLDEAESQAVLEIETNFKNQESLTEKEVKYYCQAIEAILDIYENDFFPGNDLEKLGFTAKRFVYVDTKIQSFSAIAENLVEEDDLEPYSLPTEKEKILLNEYKELVLKATNDMAEKLANEDDTSLS